MIKKLLALLAVGMMAGCDDKPTVKTTPTDKVVDIGIEGVKLKTANIEGCEYFVGRYDRSAVFCHKGNCKNLIHER
jgi:hypothetical protein